MRHAVYGRKLGRDTKARKALLRNLASDFLVRGSIETTVSKAKFARPFIEKLITHAKKSSLVRNRALASVLTGAAFNQLTNVIGPGMKNRTGGYLRITRLSLRRGDSAPMAKLEFLNIEKTKLEKTDLTKPKKI